MAKNLLAITTAGQLRWLEEAISTLRDPLNVLVIDDATPGCSIRDFCGRKEINFLTKIEPMGLTNSWNAVYQYFKEHNYDNCILCNDDVRFPAGFSEEIFEGLKKFDLIAPLSNEPGFIWDDVHSPVHQEIRRYVDVEPNERDIDRVQGIISKRYKKAPFRQANFINGFCFAFSSSISKFAYDKQFLFNPVHINTWNEYDLAERINRKGGKVGICKTSYVFHWKAKTTEKLDRNGVVSGDYREQLWRKEERVENTRIKGRKIKVGGILPHLGMYGGVRIFLELGNVFVKRGIDYTLFVDKSKECDWLDFKGKIEDWSNIEADYIIIGDTPSFRVLPEIKGKVFIWVIAGGHYLEGYKSVYGKYPFIIQNRAFLEYFPNGHLIEGGINTEWFHPRKRKVLFYDDPRPFKGAAYIKEQLGDLENVELIGLKGLSNKGIAEAYRKGDYFVAWESRQGWSGTGAQAVASGLTVVTNGVNCEPFLDKVIVVKDLRGFFNDPMKEFSWERVADKLLQLFENADNQVVGLSEQRYKQDPNAHWRDFCDEKPNLYQQHVRRVVDFFKDKKGNLLDVGCGNGLILSELNKIKTLSCWGIDISKTAIDIAKEKGVENCEAIDLFDLSKCGYDYVFLGDLLEHLPDPERALKKVRECLKPKGIVFISVPIQERKNRYDFHLFTKESAFNLVKKVFKTVSFEEDHKKMYFKGKR